MTDREKLLVSVLSKGGAQPDGRVSELEVVARLYELGVRYRRLPGHGRRRYSVLVPG